MVRNLLVMLEWPPGEGNGYLLLYSCLENSMDRETWWATVHGVAKSHGHDWATNTLWIEPEPPVLEVQCLTAKPPGKSLYRFLHSPSQQPQCWIHREAYLPPNWAWISSTPLPLHCSFPPVFTAYSCFLRVLSLPCEVVWPHYSIGSVHLRSTFVTPQH